MTVPRGLASPTAPAMVCATTEPATALRDGGVPIARRGSSAPTIAPGTGAARTSRVLAMMVGWETTVLSSHA